MTIVVSKWSGASAVVCSLFIIPWYGFTAWISFSDIIVGHEDLHLTIDGIPYLHSTCYTESDMRRLILYLPNRMNNSLVRFLLRMEKVPYKMSLLCGYLCELPFVVCQIDVPSSYVSREMPQLRRQAWATAQAFFLVIFAIARTWDMILQIRKLQQTRQDHEDIAALRKREREALIASLEEPESWDSSDDYGIETQNPTGESSQKPHLRM